LLKLSIKITPSDSCRVLGAKTRERFATCRSFLRNQAAGIDAIDVFVVTSTSFRLLYVIIILADDRRTIVRCYVTRYPTAGWLTRQSDRRVTVETAPRYLLRDRMPLMGQAFRKQVDVMGITKVVSAARSP
jgi:putative transposase